MMDRIAVIEDYGEKARIGDNSVLYALIRCLDVDESVTLLRRSLSGTQSIRDASLKVVLEHASESWTDFHEKLIDDIIGGFEKLSPNRRGSVFYCLGELARVAPFNSRAVILRFLLSSRYAAGRRKGLSILESNEISAFRDDIERCALEHREFKALLLLVEHFEPKYLYENRRLILDIFDEDRGVGRLYLRAAEHEPACVEELREIDGIIFAYAKAKLNQPLSEDDAMLLLEEFCHDDRLGLLIWAFGKMNHWNVLVYAADRYEEWQVERISKGTKKGIV